MRRYAIFVRRAIKLRSPRHHPAVIAAVLNKLSLWHFFDVVCSADDEERGKPHPAVYLTTLRKLNLNASQCLVIEDSFTGFCAAQAAGIPTAMVAEDSRQGAIRPLSAAIKPT